MTETEKIIFEKAKYILNDNVNYSEYKKICKEAKICPNDGFPLKEELHTGLFGGAVFLKCNSCNFDELKH